MGWVWRGEGRVGGLVDDGEVSGGVPLLPIRRGQK